jgi:hypothetical protein
MLPGFPAAVTAVPDPLASMTFVSWIGIDVPEGFAAMLKVARATTPSGSAEAFMPQMRQVPPEQVTDLFATGDTTLKLEMSDEKLNENWMAEVCAPPEDDSETGSTTALPAVPEPDPKDRVTLCPIAAEAKSSRLAVSLKNAFLISLVKSARMGERTRGIFPYPQYSGHLGLGLVWRSCRCS